jgi:hypothetical protein
VHLPVDGLDQLAKLVAKAVDAADVVIAQKRLAEGRFEYKAIRCQQPGPRGRLVSFGRRLVALSENENGPPKRAAFTGTGGSSYAA